MFLPKIDRALDVAPLIRALLVYRGTHLLGLGSSIFIQHRFLLNYDAWKVTRRRELQPWLERSVVGLNHRKIA
jgi:hypothetical protein